MKNLGSGIVGAIIQARSGSVRLSKKVLKRVCGISFLEHEIRRVLRSRSIDTLVVATTRLRADDAVERIAKRSGVQCFRGSEEDVLDRYYQAAASYGISDVVRLTGDCPLIDPEVIDKVVGCYKKHPGRYDYVSNVMPPSFPDGMDVEVFSFSVLDRIKRSAVSAEDLEHVTLYLLDRPGEFRIGNVANDADLSGIRLTLDEPGDLVLIRAIFRKLYPKNRNFSLSDILALLWDNPAFRKINSGIARNEKTGGK